jgi:luciferase family oxidoreductase group 1
VRCRWATRPRSGGRRRTGLAERPGTSPTASAAPAAPTGAGAGAGPRPGPDGARTTDKGLLIPARFDPTPLLRSPRFRQQAALLQQPAAETPDYPDQVAEVLALLRGDLSSPDGLDLHAVPGEGVDVEVWILGSSGGISAEVAGRWGLPFVANYHVSPATVLESAAAYRAAFRPSAALAAPYVMVSADAVVAPDEDEADELASPYGLWVRSIRTGQGAMPFPSPAEAAAHRWSAEDRALVADRVDSQFVGSPRRVAALLGVLVDETGADELIVTTITHRHADRVRSYRLLALEWAC